MKLSERIARIEAERRLPTNVHPIDERPARRTVPRWQEWTREHEQGSDLTGRIRGEAA
jgi:hypothetical protein